MPKFLTLPSLVFLALSSLLWACQATLASKPVGYASEVTENLNSRFQLAEDSFQAGRYDESARQYNEFIEKEPYNRLTDVAYYRLGSQAVREDDWETASNYFQKSTARVFDPEYGPQALYMLAVSQYRLEHFEASQSILKDIPKKSSTPLLRIRIGTLWIKNCEKLNCSEAAKAEAYLNSADAYELLSQTERASPSSSWLIPEEDAKAYVKQWKDSGEAPILQLAQWSEDFKGRQTGAIVHWKMIQAYNQQGLYKESKEAAEHFLVLYPKDDAVFAARMILMENQRRIGELDISIGVLLPLEGPYRVASNSVLHGLECAAGIFQPCLAEHPVRLVIRDTDSGDPRKATAAMQELAGQGVVALVALIVGPEAEAMADLANRLHIPLILLTPRSNLENILGQYVTRNFFTVADQVRMVAKPACQVKGRKFAILYPNSPIGNRYATDFTEAVEACGGLINSKESYDPNTKDFTVPVRNLKLNQAQLSMNTPLQIDVLFIADTYKNTLPIAEALRTLKIEIPLILGTSGWNHPDLAQDPSGVLNGAIFPDGFWVGSRQHATRDFVSRFRKAYQIEPTLLEAYGFDSLTLITSAARDHRISREELKDYLFTLKNFKGATGLISMNSRNELSRDLFLLTLEQGRIEELP